MSALIGRRCKTGLGIGAVFGLFAIALVVGVTMQSAYGVGTKQTQLERLAR